MNNILKIVFTYMMTLSLTGVISLTATADSSLPGDSIYQLDGKWQNQYSQKLKLQQLSGKKQVVSMIYTHCLHTCPTIVATMQAIEKELLKNNQNDIGFVLISLTPESDTPKVLADFAKSRKLNKASWTLLTGRPTDVRAMAMALNVKYKNVDGNEVAHSNVFTVLDESGVTLFQEVGDIGKAADAAKRIVE